MFDKKDKKMSPLEQKAKLKALKEANGMASDMLKGQLSGLKKVTVASDSKEGLKKGLDKAEDMLGEQEDEDSELGEQADAESDEYESAQDEAMPMDEDELDKKIQELMALKEKLKK